MVNKKMIGNLMRALFVSGLAWLLVLPSGAEAGGRTWGAKVIVVTGGTWESIRGELIGVRSDAIVIETEGGAARTVAIADISSVRVLRKSAAGIGALLGGLAGGFGGAAMANHEVKKDPWVTLFGAHLIIPLAGVVVGGASGGLIGGLLSKDKTYNLAKMSEAEVRGFMSKLRKMSRVKNYQ